MISLSTASTVRRANHHGESVRFQIDNTYTRINRRYAPRDRSGQYVKVHDWVLFVNVLQQDESPDIIERVSFDLGSTFQPSVFHCTTPVPVVLPNSSRAWQFSTRQQSYGAVTAQITIRGAGGTILKLEHEVKLTPLLERPKPPIHTFTEARSVRPLRTLALPATPTYGIELELTSPVYQTLPEIAQTLGALLVDSYSQGRVTSEHWKLVPDSSIVCNPSRPDCNTFELVSPILRGGDGLSQINHKIQMLGQHNIQVNKSMGFHVHVDVSHLTLAQLIKVCQQFGKYEQVMDTWMPPSRRTGSDQSNRYFQSIQRSTKAQLEALNRCGSIDELANLVNPDGSRYYKLNLQNLVEGRQQTVEFRQHSATASYEKIANWVRFCLRLVENAAKYKAPQAFASSTTLDGRFEALFQYVIKDRALRDFYKGRQAEMNGPSYCCDGCARGSYCQTVTTY